MLVDQGVDDGLEFLGIAFSFGVLGDGEADNFICFGHKIFNDRVHGQRL